MTEGHALRHAIREYPDDDTPRLAYADWLDERGREPERDRAEFIRLQCEAAKLPADDVRLPALTERIDAIKKRYLSAWLYALIEMDWVGWEDLEYERGFLKQLIVLVDEFDFEQVSKKFLIHEPAEFVVLGGSLEGLTKALKTPAFGLVGRGTIRLKKDPIERGDGDALIELVAHEEMRAVTRFVGTSTLRSFGFINSGLTDSGMQTICKSPVFSSLEVLALDQTFLTMDGVIALRDAPFAPHLRKLHLEQERWPGSDEYPDLASLFTENRFPCLRDLNLTGYPLTGEGLRQVSQGPLAGQIRFLTLNYDYAMHGEGVAMLFDRNLWPDLEMLSLCPVFSDREDLVPLLNSDRFATLHTFYFYAEDANPSHARTFAANPLIQRLRRLVFTGRHLDDEGAVAIVESPYLQELRALELAGDISLATLQRLADPNTLPALQRLQLTNLQTMSSSVEEALRLRFGEALRFNLVDVN